MVKEYILVFIVSVIIVIYIINKRLQQKNKEKDSTNNKDHSEK